MNENLTVGRISVVFMILLHLFFFTPDCSAQLNSKVSVSFDFIIPSNLQDSIPGVPTSGAAEWEFLTGEAMFSFPLFAAYETQGAYKIPTQALISTFSYQSKILKETLFGLSDEHFNALNYSASYLQRLSGPWYLNVIGGIGIAADDLGQVEAGDISYQAGLYVNRSSSEGWSWGVGFIISQFTGETSVSPMVSLSRETDDIKFELLVPKISFEYKLSTTTTIGLVGEIDGDLYVVANSNATLFDSDGNIVEENVGVELAFSETQIGPQFKISPSQTNLTITIQSGISIARRFEFLAEGSGTTLTFPPGSAGAGEDLDFAVESNIFFKATVDFEL